MSLAKAALQNIVDSNAQILRGWHPVSELGQGIQVLVIESLQDFPRDKTIQVHKVANHPRGWIDLAADRHFERVIVPVSMWVIALAIGRDILRGRHGVVV